MTNPGNVDTIFDKIEEIRGFFKFGDKIIPFLGDMFRFLRDVMPLMNTVNASLEDSKHKIPTASERITSANQTSEMATHDILDKLDCISLKMSVLSVGAAGDKKEAFDQIQDDVMDIISALQFQDITSQKLDHANRILSAIQEKFVQLFAALEQVKTNTTIGNKVMDEFNNGILREEVKHGSVELDDRTVDIIRHEEISQDDIDKLFSQ